VMVALLCEAAASGAVLTLAGAADAVGPVNARVGCMAGGVHVCSGLRSRAHSRHASAGFLAQEEHCLEKPSAWL
jgi:hypothetical protein